NRHLLNLWRQPIWIAVTLVQPVVWLLLYGALFKSVTRIPGFHSTSYIQFLTPGIVVMSALFSAGWSGMAVIDDIDKGILDRFLVSPVVRGSLIIGRPVNGAVEAGRNAVLPGTDWGMVLTRLGLLAVLTGVCIALATRAFGAYQRAV